MTGLSRGITGEYLDPDARRARLRELATRLDTTPICIGTSCQGEPIEAVVARATTSSPVDLRLLCCGNIHGVEYVAGLVAMGLLEALASNDSSATRLRSRADVWVIPCANPDGYRRVWEEQGRGPLSLLRTNARGVDLNRNFPTPKGSRPSALPGAGSNLPGRATYRGPAPLSEPETAALDQLCASQGFHASANLHSFMGRVIPARVTDRHSFAAYRHLCHQFATAQAHTHYRRLSNRWIDAWTGEQEDHQHHNLGCWAVCIETFSVVASYRQHLRAPSTFWRFNPRVPAPWVANDVPGLLAFFHAALDLAKPGFGAQANG